MYVLDFCCTNSEYEQQWLLLPAEAPSSLVRCGALVYSCYLCVHPGCQATQGGAAENARGNGSFSHCQTKPGRLATCQPVHANRGQVLRSKSSTVSQDQFLQAERRCGSLHLLQAMTHGQVDHERRFCIQSAFLLVEQMHQMIMAADQEAPAAQQQLD
jgi:hypothetical protein